jgi:SulP family sulfate permease
MKKTFIADLLSGLTVSFAALSLGAAFGVMSHRGAFAGMIGSAIIPIITSVFGGTRIQASGPTAPMTAITALIISFAYEKFESINVLTGPLLEKKIAPEQFITLTILLSAIFIIFAGIFKLGRFIKIVPQVVVLGFMNGIAVLIWVGQIKKLFGLGDKVVIGGELLTNIIIAFGTFGSIYLIPFILKKLNVPSKFTRFVPAIFITIISVTIYTSFSAVDVEHVSLGTTVSSFGEFTDLLIMYFPSDFSLFTTSDLLLSVKFAFQLCLLAYLDSLLTSLIVDKMTKESTDPNKELVAQGLANGVSGLLQGIPGAQATIRSVLLIKEGGKTRLAGIFVGVFTLAGFVLFSDLIVLITSAVFVGVLFKAGLDVFDRDFPGAYFKYKWYKSKVHNIQFAFILYTTLITVLIDLNVAVISGTILFYLGKKYLNFVDFKAGGESTSF